MLLAPPAPQVEQCRHRYLLHLDGNAYSAGLKYKLACGALVFKAASNHSEFYERGLAAGIHYVEVPLEGSAAAGGSVTAVDDATSSTFVRRLASLLRWYAATPEGRAEAAAIAARGQQFARTQLTPRGLACYWYVVLRRYIELLYEEPRSRDATPPAPPAVATAAALEANQSCAASADDDSRASTELHRVLSRGVPLSEDAARRQDLGWAATSVSSSEREVPKTIAGAFGRRLRRRQQHRRHEDMVEL